VAAAWWAALANENVPAALDLVYPELRTECALHLNQPHSPISATGVASIQLKGSHAIASVWYERNGDRTATKTFLRYSDGRWWVEYP
jgi:hypothetical protein